MMLRRINMVHAIILRLNAPIIGCKLVYGPIDMYTENRRTGKAEKAAFRYLYYTASGRLYVGKTYEGGYYTQDHPE